MHNRNVKMGHWCILVKYNNNLIFFDPYGDFIDDQLHYIDPEYNELVNQDYPVLSKLLYECPYKVHYNPFRLQKLDENISTCGRHCAVFLKYFKDYPNVDDYAKDLLDFKKNGYDIDELIVTLSDLLANNKLN